MNCHSSKHVEFYKYVPMVTLLGVGAIGKQPVPAKWSTLFEQKKDFNTLTINIDSFSNNPTSNASLRFDWRGNGGNCCHCPYFGTETECIFQP